MVSISDKMKSLVDSELVLELSSDVCSATKSKIYDKYLQIMFDVLMKQFSESKLSFEEIESILKEDRERFVRYAKLAVLSSKGLLPDQEYPPGYDPDESDAVEVKKDLGLSKDFLVKHLFDYGILKNRPENFEPYLKALRIPGAKKELRRLEGLFRLSEKSP
jgi:hypothetical protein